MRFWFDTEFIEDGHTIDLISIGVVAEDGRTYYAETDADLSRASDWVKANVIPHLQGGFLLKHRWTIADELIQFMGTKPEIWAYYCDYDWVSMCQLYGRMLDLPPGWPKYCLDVKQLAVMKGNPKLPPKGVVDHHALADAQWTKTAWEFLQRDEKNQDLIKRLRAYESDSANGMFKPRICGEAANSIERLICV